MAKKKKGNDNLIAILDKVDRELGIDVPSLPDYGIPGAEIIEKMNIGDADLEYMQIFGANKNLYRVICSLVDGLKPGKRRMLYMWWKELEHSPTNTKKETLAKRRFFKGDNISAKTQEIHPHSTTPIDELTAKEAQYWNNNVLLIDGAGNMGNLRGDPQAAGRYREARLSEYAIDCFFSDFFDYCIPMKEAYTGITDEPEFLPAKYPHVLFNPQFSGIGYGLSSNIPPFNVTEVLDATIKLIKNPKAKILLIPDSPTGCDIIDNGLFKDINEIADKNKKYKVVMRATSEIDYKENTITITSLPLAITSQYVIDKVIKIRKAGDKTFNEIIDIKDYTREGTVEIKFVLSKTSKPDNVLKKLYKKDVGLKKTSPVVLTVIDDYKVYLYSLRDLILNWIDMRIDLVRSMLLYKYQKLFADMHMNEVLMFIFNEDNIDVAVKIAKSSNSNKDMAEKLMQRFHITSVQAETIAQMHIYNMNKNSYEKYKEENKRIKEEIAKVEKLLTDDDEIRQYIIDQLEEGKKKWGRPRKSKVIKEDDNEDLENIPDTDHLIGVTESGWIKKVDIEKESSIGQVGKTNSNLSVIKLNNRENLLIIDSTGNVVKVPISSIPDMSGEEIGFELCKLFSVKGDVKAIMELPSEEMLDQATDDDCLLIVTSKGIAKRVPLKEFKSLSSSKQAITLSEGDEIATAIFTFQSNSTHMKDIIICTDQANGIRLPIKEIKVASLSAKGMNVISLKEGEVVSSASLVTVGKPYLFYITSTGKGKITESKYFPVMERKSEPISLITLTGTETLVGVSSVGKTDIVEVYRKKSEPIRINISDLKVSTRIAKGEKLFKSEKGDTVISYKVFKR